MELTLCVAWSRFRSNRLILTFVGLFALLGGVGQNLRYPWIPFSVEKDQTALLVYADRRLRVLLF